MKKILIIVITILLSGCVTPEERAQIKLNKEKALIADDQNRCLNYGFTTGTSEFSNCMMQLDMARKEEKALKEVLRCERAKQRQANKKSSGLTGWGAVLEGAMDQAEIQDCD